MTYEPPHSHNTARSTAHSRRNASGSTTHHSRGVRRPPTRFAEVRRRRSRLLLALYFALGLELVLAILTSPILAVRHTRIDGITGLTASETESTRQAASVTPGVNWLRAPVREVEAKLKSLPWLRTTTVGRKFPNSLEVDLTVRQPCLALYTASGSYEVDADNTPIRRLRPEMIGKLPTVSFATTLPIQPGYRINSDGLSAAVHITQSTQSDSRVRISKIEVDQSGDIWLNMQNGIRILLGQAEEVDTKIAVIRRMFNKDPNLGARLSEINLSCPDWPACRLRVPTLALTNIHSITSSSERQEARQAQ